MPRALISKRTNILRSIREFFQARDVLEVTTPLLYPFTVTDVFVNPIKADGGFLQTSPEYCMKQLLANGSGDIYQIGAAFRDDEASKKHRREFTLLEWYRLGFNHHDLMDEMDLFLQQVIQAPKAERVSYQALFMRYLNIDPHHATLEDLQRIASAHQLNIVANALSKTTWLELLFNHLIEHQFANTNPVFVFDFPIEQAALAKVRDDTPPVAERFEVYYKGLELANGFHELTDADSQHQRFVADNITREQLGLETREIDPDFINALKKGLPPCSGVALGVDRLMMLALEVDDIGLVRLI